MFKFSRLFNSVKFGRRFCSSNPKQDSKYSKMALKTSIFAGSIFIAGYFYKKYRIDEFEKLIVQNKLNEGVGTPLIGGDFHLVDHNGTSVSLLDFRSKWLLIYFGFCNCPDVCPDQIEKVVMVVDRLAHKKINVVPLFVSVDPERDTPEIMKDYLKEFSNKILGLTGSVEDIHAVSKTYRIYYSKGPVDKFGDYIVDHAIIMYLIGPEGEFVEYYGQNRSVPEIARSIQGHMLKKQAA